MNIIGIDEVGRGAWAGPLVLGLVRFRTLPAYVAELQDSKILSASQREKLARLIHLTADCALGTADSQEVDTLGLTVASQKAILRGLKQLGTIRAILIDGSVNFLKGTPYEHLTSTLVKADQSSPEVMAASIIAKVYRDDVMKRLGLLYPDYGFNTHVGYGTKKHLEALKKHGVLAEHRLSYKPVQLYV